MTAPLPAQSNGWEIVICWRSRSTHMPCPVGKPRRLSILIAEKPPAFDGVCHRYGDHAIPSAVVVFDAPKSVAREYAEDIRVESDDALVAVILQQERIEACKVVDNSQVLRVDQHIRPMG